MRVVRALRVLREHSLPCDYVYLLSGSCMPARPICELKLFLEQNANLEFIESKPESWIVEGLRRERYLFRHFFNQRDQKRRFNWNWKTQNALGVRRQFPEGLRPRFGSQWWCLTRKTCMAVLEYIETHPSHYQFFKTTWIPDELFFQTMVNALVERDRIFDNSLTYFKFTRKGKPVIFYDDHLDALGHIPYFFMRKVGPRATWLRQFLAEVAARPEPGPLPEIGKGPGQFDYERRVAQQIDFPRPGQLFYGWQKFEGWPASMGAFHRPFAVLYGPPALTRIARDELRGASGLTALGHIFHPREVDFGDQPVPFKGLEPSDVAIRDYDPPLYLTRVIERCEGVPILELAPGEDWPFELALPRLDSAVAIPCLPHDVDNADWMRLFWALSAISQRGVNAGDKEPAPRDSDSFFPYARRSIDWRIEQSINKDHRDYARRYIIATRNETSIPLFWGAPPAAEPKAGKWRPPKSPESLLTTMGAALIPLISKFVAMQAALSRVSFEQSLEPLPERWRLFFRSVIGRPHGFADSKVESSQERLAARAFEGKE